MIDRRNDLIMAKTKKPTPESRAGLTQAVFHILLALADAPKHGYAIMQEVDHRAGSRYRLWPATLYTAIKRMLADELIEETRAPNGAAGEDPRRRFYRLTRHGRAELTREASRLESLLELAREKKVLPAG
jgi:DNA-binding PadR family transcriptional regulator